MRSEELAEREGLGSNPLRICNINLAPPAETEIQLTAPDGWPDNRRDFEADSDIVAVSTAKQWRDGNPIEVWCGPILIETIKQMLKRGLFVARGLLCPAQSTDAFVL